MMPNLGTQRQRRRGAVTACSLACFRACSIAALIACLTLAPLPAFAADDSAQMELGKSLFLQGSVPACAVCHTLKAADAVGAVGPVLDDLKPDTARVITALRNGIGLMPSYNDTLTDEQISALALFVSRSSGGAK